MTYISTPNLTHARPCAHCGGEGWIWKSRYGGNDPDVWKDRRCEACDGSGTAVCDDCGEREALYDVTWRDRTYQLCALCEREWRDEE